MKNTQHLLCSLLFCLISSISFSQVADTTFLASKDAYISSNAVSTNYGTVNPMRIGRASSSRESYFTMRAVIAFDLSSIPSNAIIVSAELKLFQTEVGNPNLWTARIIENWHEDTITWANQPDHEVYDLITTSSVISGYHTVGVKEHVQKMVAGVYTNHGWLLLNDNETLTSDNYKRLQSREDVSKYPYLKVEYYVPIEVSSALIVHASDDEAEDGSISPTLDDGPGGLSYKWYNSEDSVLSTSLNLEDVPYGWYGLEVASSNVSDTFYHAFIVGIDCDVVDIEFTTSPKYTSNAQTAVGTVGVLSETNMGNVYDYGASEFNYHGYVVKREDLLKFNLWLDSLFVINHADLALSGSDHLSSIRNNEASLHLISDYWDETIVTWSSRPEYSDSLTIYLDSTTITDQNRTIDMTAIWKYWKDNKAAHHGIAIQLENYMSSNASQVYHSPNATSSSNYPKIDFTLDLRKPAVTMAWDTVVHAGELFIDLNNVCGKTAPYKYMIAQDSIPDLGDLYTYINDSIFSSELDSTTFFSGTTDLTKLYEGLSSGTYYIAVFDSSWNRIVDEEIQVHGEFEFLFQNSLEINANEISATSSGAYGSINSFAYGGENSELQVKFDNYNGSQYFGYSKITDSTVSVYGDLAHGFYMTDDTLYTVESGVLSHAYQIVDSLDMLSISISDTTLQLKINNEIITEKSLDPSFAFKTELKLDLMSRVRILGPVQRIPFYFVRSKLINHVACDGTILGGFNFNLMSPFYPWYLGHPPIEISFEIRNETNSLIEGGSISSYSGFSIAVQNLLPGTYSISVTLAGGGTYFGTFTIGYETDWTQVVDYDHIPNPYSLLRTEPSTTNYQEPSFAGATNFLAAGNEGWAEFSTHRENSGPDIVRFSTLNITSMAIFPIEELIAFANFGSIQFHVSLIGGNFDLSLSPPGPFSSLSVFTTKVRLEFETSDVVISFNGNEVVSRPSSMNRMLRFQTLSQNNGFKDIITSFPCPSQGLDKMSHAELRRQLDGGYTHAVEGTLLFTFDEEYDTEASQYVALNIYDETYELEEHINFGGTAYSGTAPVDYEFDDNKRVLDISGLGLNIGEFYILEVVTSKGEKLYLRFLFKS